MISTSTFGIRGIDQETFTRFWVLQLDHAKIRIVNSAGSKRVIAIRSCRLLATRRALSKSLAKKSDKIKATVLRVVTLFRNSKARERSVPCPSGLVYKASRMILSTWLVPFREGMNISTLSVKAIKPTRSLFLMAEKREGHRVLWLNPVSVGEPSEIARRR